MHNDRPAIDVVEPNLNKSEPPALRFETHEDALDYARKIMEDCKRWFVSHNASFVERFVKGELYIVFGACFFSGDLYYDLVFSIIPPRGADNHWGGDFGMMDKTSDNGGPNQTQNIMLISIAFPIECPKKTVPVFVWLERSDKRDNFVWEFFASPTNMSVKLSSVVSKGEISFLPPLDSSTDKSDSVPYLIKSRPKVVNNVGCNSIKFGKGFSKLQFENFIRVGLNDEGVWFCTKESFDSRFEFDQMLLCSR